MTEPNVWASHLIDVVTRLAAPPAEQLRYLDELGAEPDELALEFDDYFRVGLEHFEDDDRRTLEQISQTLSAMSGKEKIETWSRDAVLHSEAWQKVRDVATRFTGTTHSSRPL